MTSNLPTLKFESIKVSKEDEDIYIQVKGQIGSNHPNYSIGDSIYTSYVVFYDEGLNLIQTANGFFYHLESQENDKKFQLLSVLARKNNLSNVG